MNERTELGCFYKCCGWTATKCLRCVDEDGGVALIWLCDEHYTSEIIDEYREAWVTVEC